MTAELNGDEEFAKKNYEAARRAYLEALYNFKKSLEQSNEFALLEGGSDESNLQPIVENDAGEEEAVKTKAKEHYEAAIREERRRLAREETEKAIAAPATIEATAAENDSLNALRSRSEAVRASLLTAKNKVGNESYGELPFQEAVRIEAKADLAFAEKNFAEANDLYTLGEKQYAAVAAEAETRRMRREQDRLDAAQREIRKLLDSYKSNFENRNIQGLKALFDDGFTAEDENAWLKFFRNAREVKANVADESIQIGANNAEVQLAVLIDYANHKGILQEPLALKESWTLEERNGKWLIVTRQFR